MKRREVLRQAIVLPPLMLHGGAGLTSWNLSNAAAPFTSTRRHLRMTLSFRNDQQQALQSQTFWCYLPAQIQAVQQPSKPMISMGHKLHEDVLGHRVLELSFDSVAPLAHKVVTVAMDVDFFASEAVLPEGEKASWLQAERFIESDDSRIIAVAEQLKGPNPRATVQAIFGWVQEHVHYSGYVAPDMGALHALLKRDGDCTEYANLVVALARAAGIPARMMGGYVVDRDMALRSQDYHNWAEVCLDGRWRMVDAQKGNFLTSSLIYVAFRIYRDRPTNPVGLAHRYRVEGSLQVSMGAV